MTIYARSELLSFCCGVSEVGDFNKNTGIRYGYEELEKIIENIGSSNETGYIVCTFIDNTVCKEAYEFLCKKAKLVTQTKPKVNYEYVDNKVFVAVFNCKGKK